MSAQRAARSLTGGRATRQLLAALVALVALVLASPRAMAQAVAPQINVSASQPQAEVGEPFTVELRAMSEQGSPVAESPMLAVPPGLSAQGPMIATQQQMNIINGRTTSRAGISATWSVTGSKPGRYTIPGPTVRWNGSRLAGSAIQVQIVPATGKPRRQSAGSLMPGGPGGLGFPWPFGQPQPAEEDDLHDTGQTDAQELAMDVAPDSQVFLRAKVDKKTAVVGEQVTIAFYLYQRVSLEMSERQEASLADFVRVPLLKNPGAEAPVTAVAGGNRYLVRVLDKVAVFPIKTGDLHTGSLLVRFGRRGRPRLERKTDDVVIRVTEPPVDGRPPGYAIGDVGQLSLTATVEPRRIEQGGSVAVTVKVSGRGNLPQALNVPARTGVEWLDPEKREAIEPSGDVVQGYRSFGYVVRVSESGAVDLGKIDLPYWDPQTKRYVVATVKLGTLEVKPMKPALGAPAGSAGAPAASAEPDADPFADMPRARRSLGVYAPPAGALVEGSLLWLLIAAPPLLFGVVSAGARASREVRKRRVETKSSPEALAAKALREAEAAAAGRDGKALAAAVERALHHAIEGATGLRSRGVLLSELPRELASRGVPEELSRRAAAALDACDRVRFDPDAEALGDLGSLAREVVRDLERTKLS